MEGRVSSQESAKSKARAVIEQLPDAASWDEVLYELYVREAVDAGLADVAAGRTLTIAEVRERLAQRIQRVS